jgi:hypothetical protein
MSKHHDEVISAYGLSTVTFDHLALYTVGVFYWGGNGSPVSTYKILADKKEDAIKYVNNNLKVSYLHRVSIISTEPNPNRPKHA